MNEKDFDFSFAAHIDHYPVIIPRVQVAKYFPWLTAKRVANLDSLGEGPAQVIKNGRAILYPTKAFLEWLDSRTSKIQTSDQGPELVQETAGTVGLKTKKGRKTKLQEVRERRG